MLGEYLIENSNIVSSSSYYDAGYGLLSSFETALTQHNTTFTGHYITPFMLRENEADFMRSEIEMNGTDAVFAFHSGLYAKEHATLIAQTDLLGSSTIMQLHLHLTKISLLVSIKISILCALGLKMELRNTIVHLLTYITGNIINTLQYFHYWATKAD